MTLFIIEHLEPFLSEWCFEEYRHIVRFVGRKNVVFTNVSSVVAKRLSFANTASESVSKMEFGRVCVLDPESERILSPLDAVLFDAFIFGGILGDNPPRKRTKEELTGKFLNIQTRSLGDRQMSTDTAVMVVKSILDGAPFSKFKFVDNPEFKIDDCLSLVLPYRYLANSKGKPLISKKVLEIAKKEF